MAKIIGFAGYSGSGKTTLIEKLIPIFTGKGLRVSVIKHAHHRFDIDIPGKDSWRHREAGATEVLVASSHRWVLMHELRNEPEPDLDQLINRLTDPDIIIVEGFKTHPIKKIEVWRELTQHPRIAPNDPHVVAVASDKPTQDNLIQLDINQPQQIVEFILKLS
ncbi:molybdopterin-guanine dinucleotide biosynthesis protein B [Ferrovum sp. PN-J185]|uniref:molybdopterin-guanine dinucleotide biosynthesis protein B n=1 Tax=Ferrovum sp. PN-J185 TaxID=1356306 RepID=UPI0007964558|nr:molybdopterin-guanine dinucleotide biosynthesis protein B [Ferrovum sp. PN-J185]KXW56718.1 molybdopterin-guanine dinucleotide biosynthesis adapter protein [Ferrovum sp. PN-J185]MCC6067597.1 molybdopterin-guanine dinucleotide biosynthesis protein B [Ferrovum sp. PN-J185]MDE1892043.1 molybdopterin-guanine dinucleotide biosynthesis protein B [Betaproteobacteria bacterium]MDE2056508.1 molybdopterin-guanine dinucleotide biosynthesis protein B [Betaproteobacteria bacterium]